MSAPWLGMKLPKVSVTKKGEKIEKYGRFANAFSGTVERIMKDHPIWHKESSLSRQVVFGDRFSYIEM